MSKAMTLTKAQQRQVDAIAEVLKPWGLTWVIGKDGPHFHVRIAGPKGGTWKVTIAGTPRDPDHAVAFARQNARRALRDINRRLGL